MSVKERLEQFCEYRKLTIGAFCREAKISNSYFANVKGEMGTAIRGRIKETFPELNLNWLMNGEGEMLNVNTPAAIMSPYPQTDLVETTEVATRDCYPQCPVRIPYVKSDITSSRDVNIKQLIESESELLEYKNLRQLVGCPDYARRVITSAMVPDFQSGDIIFGQFLPTDAKLVSGAIYHIDTCSYGAMIRQLYVEGDTYILHAKNPEFRELVLHHSEVYSISRIIKSLRSDFNLLPAGPDALEISRKRDEQIDKLLSMHSDAMGEIRLQNERMAEERRRQDEERKSQMDQLIAERARQDKLIEKLLNLKQ